jgi:hypothetical protein
VPGVDLVPTDWLNLHHEPANFHSVIFAPPSAIVHGVAFAHGIGVNDARICQTGQIERILRSNIIQSSGGMPV